MSESETDSGPRVTMAERLMFARGAMRREAIDLRQRLPALEADGIRAAEEKRALELALSRRSVDGTQAAAFRAQYAERFAEYDARIGAPEAAKRRLDAIASETERLGRQLQHERGPGDVFDTLRAWGARAIDRRP